MRGSLLGTMAVVAASLAACRRPAPPPAVADAPVAQVQGSRFALVIGSNIGSPERKPLRYAEHDASRLIAVLRELGGFRGPNTQLLLAPSAARVRSALQDLRTRVQLERRERPGSRALALVYYSGHSNGRAMELGGERLEFEQVQQTLIDSGADMRMLVVDACQSGTLLALKGGNPKPGFDLEAGGPDSTGEAILTSAAESEDALESSELQASFFSHHLLSGLRGAADGNGDGRVTLSEAYQYASARTVAETTATIYGAQHPTYRLRLSGQGDLALTELPAARASVEVTGELDRVLFIDALSGMVAGEWAGGTGRRLSLTGGPYLIKAWRKGRILNGRMTLGLGETRKLSAAELSDAAPAPPPALAAMPGPVPDAVFRRTVSAAGECRFRCVVDPNNERATCDLPVAVSVLAFDVPRIALAVDMPGPRSLLRLRFEVCDPREMVLHVADSPSCNGGGGDATQFSNDAEIELRSSGLWVFGNDYARGAEKSPRVIGSRPDFVATSGCSVRTLVLADGSVRSPDPPISVRSPYALRLDPPSDHEGQPDRRWYIGLNRSVGSNAPGRIGTGLSWMELCILDR